MSSEIVQKIIEQFPIKDMKDLQAVNWVLSQRNEEMGRIIDELQKSNKQLSKRIKEQKSISSNPLLQRVKKDYEAAKSLASAVSAFQKHLVDDGMPEVYVIAAMVHYQIRKQMEIEHRQAVDDAMQYDCDYGDYDEDEE